MQCEVTLTQEKSERIVKQFVKILFESENSAVVNKPTNLNCACRDEIFPSFSAELFQTATNKYAIMSLRLLFFYLNISSF